MIIDSILKVPLLNRRGSDFKNTTGCYVKKNQYTMRLWD